MIMLADKATGTKEGGQTLLGGLPVEVHRNFFGAQAASFEAQLHLIDDAQLHSAIPAGFTGVFIRAPAILTCLEGARPLAFVRRRKRDAQVPELPGSASSGAAASASSGAAADENVIVAAESDVFLVTAFHPELTENPGWHGYFANRVEALTGNAQRGVGAGQGAGVDVVGRILAETNCLSTNMDVGPASTHVEIARRIVTGVSPI